MSVTNSAATIILSSLLSSCHVLADDQILIDYRSSPEPTTDSAQPVSVLSQAVTEPPCPDAEPQVLDAADGSFTAANTSQSAYLIDLGNGCRVTSPRNASTTRLAIFSGTELINYQDFSGFQSIREVEDIDRDGTDEIIIEASFISQGYQTISAQIIDVKPNESVIEDLAQVYSDNFGTLQNQTYRVASVISLAQSSNTVSFTKENYLTTCFKQDDQSTPECSPYQYISSGPFPSPEEIQKIINTTN